MGRRRKWGVRESHTKILAGLMGSFETGKGFRVVLRWGQGLGFMLYMYQSLDLDYTQSKADTSLDKEAPAVTLGFPLGYQVNSFFFFLNMWSKPVPSRRGMTTTEGSILAAFLYLVCKSFIPKGESGWHRRASNILVYHQQIWTCSLHLHQAVLS